jgi:hypothetical protein
MADTTTIKKQAAGQVFNYRGDKDNKNAVESTKGTGHKFDYKPGGKKDRDARRRIFERFEKMRDDPLRLEAQKEWDLGRKMYRMWAPEKAADDWGADVILPDGFAAIQTHLQETIDAHFRPMLDGVESSDEVLANFNNSIFQHAMDTTEFDAETIKARMASAMMGTAFTREEYRYETRNVMDPTSYKDGEIQYTKKEIVDFDDVYTRYVRPENCFFDESAEDPKYGNDCIYREVMDCDIFKDMYASKSGFKDVDKVVPAGSLSANVGFFKMAGDIEKNDVEILHYENKLTDSYDVLANNVLIHTGPLPSKHKQLTLDVWTFYPVEGQIWGMGIPKIIYTLVEERRTNRNQRIDRGTLQNHKMFLVNDLFDLDEDDLTPRPHGMARVNTNGLPISQAVMPLEYGDIPISSIRMDEELMTDERRAHGMSESNNLSPGATATQAAIMKEDTQRRINLINTLCAWNTLIRLGKKKWSNVQFFYPAARVERVMEDNKWRDKTVYRTIKTPGMQFKVYGGGDTGQSLELRATEIPGVGRAKLDPTYARYMLDDFDVVVDAQAMAIISKPIKQQQVNEMFDRVMNNPLISRYADGQKAFKRMLSVNDESAKDWMANDGMTEQDMRELAEKENMLFLDMERTKKIFAIPGTPKATEAHTEIHLIFTRSAVYQALSEPIKSAMANHIMEENDKNPNTPNVADIMSGGAPDPGAAGSAGVDPLAAIMGGGPDQGGGGNAVPAGLPGGPAAGAGMGAVPGAPVAGGDVTAGMPVA